MKSNWVILFIIILGFLPAHDARCHHLFEPNYFTEEFGPNEFDLDYHTIILTPDGSDDFYSVCEYEITGLPTDPSGGTLINPRGAGGLIVGELIILSEGKTVSFYGEDWWYFSVCGNGSVAFETLPVVPHCRADVTLELYFQYARISSQSLP